MLNLKTIIIVALFFALPCLPCAARAQRPDAPKTQESAKSLDANAFLHADGITLRSRKGEAVLLRGVNLGGWLLFEGWQTPMDASGLKDDWSVRQTLGDRFGVGMRDSLIAAYQDAWITESDLDNIAALGLNVVRLPFWYRNLQGEDGVWRADAFQRLDWLVREAGARGLYTILDFHGAQGGQSGADTTGRVRKIPELWSNPANARRALETWQRVAQRFKGNPYVAGYDLLNEPIGAPDRAALWALYDRLYKTVRAADPDHLIVMEGCWGGKVDGKYMGWGWNALPPPAQFGWANVAYEMHMYGWSGTGDNKAQMTEVDKQVADFKGHQAWNVPCYIGEFNCFGNEPAWKYAGEQFAAANINWSLWTYKATHGTGDDSWGVYNPRVSTLPKPDIQKDSADDIRAKWLQWDTATSFALNPMLARSILASLNNKLSAEAAK